MEIHEFYHCEGFQNEFNCFDGRWQFDFNSDDRIYGKDFQGGDPSIFNFEMPFTADEIYNVIPLTLRFAIMQCQDKEEKGEESETEIPKSWYILKLDWMNKKCIIGDTRFRCELLSNHHSPERAYYPLCDQSEQYSNEGDLHFLVYRKENTMLNCKLCKIKSQNIQYQQIGKNFQLPSNLFNCINLNGEIISGISTSLDEISRYNLKDGQISTSLKLKQNLPPSISLNIKDDGFYYLPTAGAWSSKNLYLWLNDEDPDNKKIYSSYIYIIDTENGSVKKVSYKFDGQIRQIFMSFNGQLLVHLEKFLRDENYKGPAWSKMLYGKRPFFEFKMFNLRFQCHELDNDKILLNQWQADAKHISNKSDAIFANFE